MAVGIWALGASALNSAFVNTADIDGSLRRVLEHPSPGHYFFAPISSQIHHKLVVEFSNQHDRLLVHVCASTFAAFVSQSEVMRSWGMAMFCNDLALLCD